CGSFANTESSERSPAMPTPKGRRDPGTWTWSLGRRRRAEIRRRSRRWRGNPARGGIQMDARGGASRRGSRQPMHGETRSPRRAWVAVGALLAGLGLAAAPAGAQPGMRKSVPAVPKRAPTRTVIVTEPAPPARVVAPAATAQPVTPAAPAAPAAPPGLGTAAALSDIAQPAPGDLFQRKPGMWDPAPLWSYLDPVLE